MSDLCDCGMKGFFSRSKWVYLTGDHRVCSACGTSQYNSHVGEGVGWINEPFSSLLEDVEKAKSAKRDRSTDKRAALEYINSECNSEAKK